ncbi:hypothetical protein QBC43DRAFT_314089 [Cladorrhinum sp. PSN259]|nr:hypothetical protein QBC43DRAFT_314089 [Cladorrhinum sp. PSN259]
MAKPILKTAKSLIPSSPFLLLLLLSSCAWALQPLPAAHLQPPQPVITQYVVARQDPNPQIQALSAQLSQLSSQSRSVSQASQQASQSLSQQSQQLSQQSAQLSNRLSQTEQQLASARAQINVVEQASRSVSQQAAEASRRIDETRRSAEQAMRQMSESMTRMMSERERQMSESVRVLGESASRAIASATGIQRAQTETQAIQGQPQSEGSDENEDGNGNGNMATQTALGIVGGVIGGIILAVGVGWGVWIIRRRNKEGSRKKGGISIGFPELKSTSNRAYASVGLGKDGPGGTTKWPGDEKKGGRDSDASFYSTDYEKGGFGGMGFAAAGDIKMPMPAAPGAAMDAPDLRVAMMKDMNRTKSLSRKSVGGGVVLKGMVQEQQPSMPGLAMSYYAEVEGEEEKQEQTPTATATVTIPAKGIGSNSNSSKDGGKFTLGNPPPPRGAGKFTLFPKSRDDFNSPLGTASTVGSNNGIPSLDTWLRKGVGSVSPFATLKK